MCSSCGIIIRPCWGLCHFASWLPDASLPNPPHFKNDLNLIPHQQQPAGKPHRLMGGGCWMCTVSTRFRRDTGKPELRLTIRNYRILSFADITPSKVGQRFSFSTDRISRRGDRGRSTSAGSSPIFSPARQASPRHEYQLRLNGENNA